MSKIVNAIKNLKNPLFGHRHHSHILLVSFQLMIGPYRFGAVPTADDSHEHRFGAHGGPPFFVYEWKRIATIHMAHYGCIPFFLGT